MQDNTITEIDLEQIIRSRAGSKAKYIPKWAVNALKRLIHQDFINEFLRRGHVGVDFCEECIRYLDANIKVRGLEHLSDDSRKYTFVSNHPLGAIDGVALGMILGRKFNGNVKYLVNDLLMNLKGLAPLCIPINKIGKQARNFPQIVEAGFQSDSHIIMFPAGLCSRKKRSGPDSGYSVEEDFYHQKCGDSALGRSDSFCRTELSALLSHCPSVSEAKTEI